MADNAFGIENVRQIDLLVQELGTIEKCEALQFVIKDKEGIFRLSNLGMGYLLYVKARQVNDVPEAFTAGWNCAVDELIEN
jgi:hypothetical protein